MRPLRLSFRDCELEDRYLQFYYRQSDFDVWFQLFIGLPWLLGLLYRLVQQKGWTPSAMTIASYVVDCVAILAVRMSLDWFIRPYSCYPRIRTCLAVFSRLSLSILMGRMLPLCMTISFQYDSAISILRGLIMGSGVSSRMFEHMGYPLPFKYEVSVGFATMFIHCWLLCQPVCHVMDTTYGSKTLARIAYAFTRFSEDFFKSLMLFISAGDVNAPSKSVCRVLCGFLHIYIGYLVPVYWVWFAERKSRLTFISALPDENLRSRVHIEPLQWGALHFGCLILLCPALWLLMVQLSSNLECVTDPK